MIHFKDNLKLERPGLLVKYIDAQSRFIPSNINNIVRFLDKEQSYFFHSYYIKSKILLGKRAYSKMSVGFLCSENECQLCADDYIIQKRYCLPVLNRDDGKIQILDLNTREFRNFEKHCNKQKISKIHEDDFSVMTNMFTGDVVILKENTTPELSIKEVQSLMGLNSYWLDEYLEEFPSFSGAREEDNDAAKIWLPDGSWALKCKKCNFDSQWAESNQDDGSFICARCRILGS